MIRNQIPHSNGFWPSVLIIMLWFAVIPILPLPFNVRIVLPDEPNQFRWINGRDRIVGVKFNASHFCQMINALAVLATTERKIIALFWFKGL